MNIVNPSNPFQIPPCLQRADSQQRRRERFKKGFIAAVVALVILLVGLLIEGCMSEKATTPAQNVQTASVEKGLPPRQQEALISRTPQTAGVPASWSHPPVEQPPQPVAQHKFNTISRTAPPIVTEKAVSTTQTQSETIYVIKSGDTYSVIAQAYREQGVKITADQIAKANPNVSPNKLHVGQKIFIPAPAAQ